MKKYLIILLQVIVLNCYALEYRVDSVDEVQSIAPYTLHHIDTTHTLGVEEIIQFDNWTETGKDGLNFGVAKYPVWIRVKLVNNDSVYLMRYLFIPYHHLEYVDFYTVKSDSVVDHLATGTARSYQNKSLHIRGYPYPVELNEGEEVDVYIRVDHHNLPLRANIFITGRNALYESNANSISLMWYWKGVIFTAALLSIITFVFIRSRLFLYYMLLLLGVALFIGAEIGDYFQFFDRDPNNRIIDIKHLGNVLVIFSFPMFVNAMCPVRKIHPRLWNFTMLLIVPFVLMFLLVLITPVKRSDFLLVITYYAISVSPFIFIMQLFFLGSAAFKKENNAILLFAIYLVYVVIFLITNSLPNFGWLSLSMTNVYAMLLVSSMAEVLTFMILVARETYLVYQQRTKLKEEAKQHEKRLLMATVSSQEEERNRVGRELHDMVGANMAVIKQKVDKEDKELRNLLTNTIETIRTLSHGLITPYVETEAFADEIRELCIITSSDDLLVHSFFENWEQVTLNSDIATHLFRIVKEFLQNAIKHSRATRVVMQFFYEDGQITFYYDDNGIGLADPEENRKGIGLMNIESRVKLLNGSFSYRNKTTTGGFGGVIKIPVS